MRRDRGLRDEQPSRCRHVRGARRYKRDGWWWAKVPGVGRFSLHTRSDVEAERLFREAVARQRRAERVGDAPEETLAVIAKSYCDAPHGWTRRQLKTSRYRALGFVDAMSGLGVTLPSQVTDRALDAWRTARGAKRSAATINRGEDVVRKMLRWAAEQKPALCAPTPMAKRERVKEIEREPNPLIPSPQETAAIVAALDGPAISHRGMALAVTVAVSVGLRIDEVRAMDETWISSDAITVRADHAPMATSWTSKAKRERKIPAPAEVVAAARELVAWRRDNNWRVSDHSVGDNLRAAARIVGITLSGFHDFRRTFATECVRAGIALTQVQTWLAHRSVRTTQRYLGRYRSDAAFVVPMPPAIAALVPSAYQTAAVVSTQQRVPETAGPSAAARKNSGKLAEETRFERVDRLPDRRFSRPLPTRVQPLQKLAVVAPRTDERTTSTLERSRFRAPNRKARS